jgi:ATP-dependent Clp protease ATP-binding subunit ClpC
MLPDFSVFNEDLIDMELSAACMLAYEFASIETVQGKHEFISPELFFAGLTKLQDMNDEETIKQFVRPAYVSAFMRELNATLRSFENRNIDIREMRHAIRKRLGDGGYNRQPGEKISRTQTTRDAFDRAESLARSRQQPIITMNLLMAVMLEVPNTHLHALLLDMNLDWQEIYNDLIEIDIDSDTEVGGDSSVPNNSTIASKKPATASNLLTQIGKDLTQLARDGKLHEVVERDTEIEKIVTALSRAENRNALLVGDAGVGKTAIVEGIAYHIANGSFAHLPLGRCRIIQIEATSLVSGTNYRGAFEERMEKLIREASSDSNLILFIDEIHMLFGAGGNNGMMDAAQIFKTALDGAQMRLIGATTEAEFRRYIQNDTAFQRRFTVVNIYEPSQEATRQILEFRRKQLQDYHQVTISDEAINAAIDLSVKYMTDRRLPDKAYFLLDSAATTVSMGKLYDDTLSDDLQSFIDTSATKIVTARHIREALPTTIDVSENLRPRDILKIADNLKNMVIGQPQAADAIAEVIVRNAAQLGQRGAMGVLLFIGPSGVGKTEMARATAELLFGSPDEMIRIDMGEYIEKHSVSRLLGSPPGYVGFENGGQLTNALLRKPRSVVLLDEIEKAHPDVLQVFLSAFDHGRITDSRGQLVDTSRAFFIMTSNLGVQPNMDFDENHAQIMLEARMKPEFLNRIDKIVYFYPLNRESMNKIVNIRIEKLQKELADKGMKLNIEPPVYNYLVEKGYDRYLGVRPLLRLLRTELMSPISYTILKEDLSAGAVINIVMTADNTITVTANTSKDTSS